MACPLCDHAHARPSWLGSTFYGGREFRYVECLECRSLYCDPMPDEETLARMYGPEYGELFAGHENMGGAEDATRVMGWLRRVGSGTFVDYGCGAGHLLRGAARLDWEAVGVEFDKDVAAEVEKLTGAKILTAPVNSGDGPCADVLHLGDVIEHLTEINRQMPEILRLIKPGGLLLAQGPLEANASLFALMLRLSRSMRPNRRTEMAPYHVLLATANGQQRFFRRFGLEEVEFSIRETAWPAPERVSFRDVGRPRALGLFAVRRLSQATSALSRWWGNRYFYAGRWNG